MFERGFKSWAEHVALEIRKDLGLEGAAPLPAQRLADYLGVALWTPSAFDGLSDQTRYVLENSAADHWSAVTVTLDDLVAVVFNSEHSARRQSSDIMHELSHLVIGHQPSTVLFSRDRSLAMRSFDRQQEEEASWLSGCLLLPRPALVALATRRVPSGIACQRYGVSSDLLKYRLNVTGVTLQIKRRGGSSGSRRKVGRSR